MQRTFVNIIGLESKFELKFDYHFGAKCVRGLFLSFLKGIEEYIFMHGVQVEVTFFVKSRALPVATCV